MDKLLARLERRFGNLTIHGLTFYMVMFQGLVLVLELGKPGFSNWLMLDRERILGGEFWRLFAYMAIPPTTSPIWGLFAIALYYTMGTSLESQWGSFKYQLFLLLGMLMTTVYGFALDVPATNAYILLSLFLAFATYWPDYELMLFFILPVKVKWLALLDVLFLLYEVGTLPGVMKVMPVLAVANYLIFFAEELWALLHRERKAAQRTRAFQTFKQAGEAARPATRVCKTCGVTDQDPRQEFRVCLCETCGGKPTMFCMAHINTHGQ